MVILSILNKAKHYQNSSSIQAAFVKLDKAYNSPENRMQDFNEAFDYLAIYAKPLLKEYFHGIKSRTKK